MVDEDVMLSSVQACTCSPTDLQPFGECICGYDKQQQTNTNPAPQHGALAGVKTNNTVQRTILIGGKQRPILFKLKAVKLYQQLTGKNLLKENLGTMLTQELEADKITALVYSALVCGCYPAQPDFSLEDVENWLGLDMPIFQEIIQAYIDFIPGARETSTALSQQSPNQQAPQPEGQPV